MGGDFSTFAIFSIVLTPAWSGLGDVGLLDHYLSVIGQFPSCAVHGTSCQICSHPACSVLKTSYFHSLSNISGPVGSGFHPTTSPHRHPSRPDEGLVRLVLFSTPPVWLIPYGLWPFWFCEHDLLPVLFITMDITAFGPGLPLSLCLQAIGHCLRRHLYLSSAPANCWVFFWQIQQITLRGSSPLVAQCLFHW